jgi:LPS-assembly lipoprotein
MSYFKLSIALMALTLTACEFKPLYHNHCESHNISYPLKIATIEDRQGQILRNYLVDLLIPQGAPAKPKYLLEIKLTDTIVDTGIKKDETTTRKKATVTAQVILRDRCQKVVYTHSVFAINSVNILSENYYSDVVAADYARREALRVLSEKIQLVISAYLDTHP